MITRLPEIFFAVVESIGVHLHPVYYIFVPYWTLILSALALSPLTVLVPQFLQGKLKWPSDADARDEWIINGKKYNLRPFYKQHPGGSFALRASRGSDCTGLFESYHIFIDRNALYARLSEFEIKDGAPVEPPAMVFYDDFYKELKASVRQYFRGKGKGAHKMSSAHLAMCFLGWATMWCMIYRLLVHDAMWTIPCIGLLSWFLTGNVMHDATHHALVRQPWLNRVFSHAAFPYGVNVAAWHIEHVMSHHIYTNEESDVDLYHFDPIITLKSGEGTLPFVLHLTRLLFILSTAIPHLVFVVPYGLLFGQVEPLHGHRMYDRIKAILAHRQELRWDLFLEMAALCFYYYTCYCYHGLVKALCVQMSIYTISSYLFTFFTQVSHLQHDCFPEKGGFKDLSFAKRQVFSSMDFAADSRFWGLVSGGLNTQAIHHIFPSVSAMHLRSLYPRFREVCERHGVVLKEARSLRSFVWGFVQFAN